MPLIPLAPAGSLRSSLSHTGSHGASWGSFRAKTAVVYEPHPAEQSGSLYVYNSDGNTLVTGASVSGA